MRASRVPRRPFLDPAVPDRRSLDIDFRGLLTGLATGERVRGASAMGAGEDIFRASEHSYRRIDAHTLLHVLNFEAGQPYALTTARRDLVCIQAIVSGSYSRWIGQRMDLVSPRVLQISNTPVSTAETEAGTRLRGLLVVCDRRHLVDHYQLNVERLPAEYRAIFLSQGGSPQVLQLPLTWTWLHLADQILSCRYQEPLKGLFVAAKTVELLCDVVAQLNAMAVTGAPRALPRPPRRQAVEAAAEIYRREFGNPPTIESLAQRVGLNRNELTAGFRDAFGVTPHAFALAQRMERAREMLHGGSLSISEIARRIGYEGYASFARAYLGFFGHGPAQDLPDSAGSGEAAD